MKREVPIRLTEKCNQCGAGAMVYKVDFAFEVCMDFICELGEFFKGEIGYVEPKGARTSSFNKRARQWKKTGPGRLFLWFGRYRNKNCIPYLAETIIPGGGK